MAKSCCGFARVAIPETLKSRHNRDPAWTSARRESIVATMNSERNTLGKVVDLRIVRALRALEQKPEERWTVPRLAKLAGASRASFVRLFRAATGTSPKRWLSARRLERTARLLVTTDQTLHEIARRVGYESEFSLSRAFKRHYGIAPARYRQLSSFAPRCAA